MFQVSANKNTAPDTYYVEQWLYSVKKCIKLSSNSTQNRQKNTKSSERQKTSFPKESVKNKDFYKLVLDKVMTTHEKRV